MNMYYFCDFLLSQKSQHDKETMRPLYDRYRLIKKVLASGDTVSHMAHACMLDIVSKSFCLSIGDGTCNSHCFRRYMSAWLYLMCAYEVEG